MMPEPLGLAWFVVWATVVGVVAVDVGKTKVFAWLRTWADRTYVRRGGLVWVWLRGVLKCPWCLCHWLSAVVCLGHGAWNPVWWLVLAGASTVPQLLICSLIWLLEDKRLCHE